MKIRIAKKIISKAHMVIKRRLLINACVFNFEATLVDLEARNRLIELKADVMRKDKKAVVWLAPLSKMKWIKPIRR